METAFRAGAAMRRVRQFLCGISVLGLCVAGPVVSAEAAVITFAATDLADLLPGEDLWMYEYFVSDFTFAANQGFSVYFDPALYTGLSSPPLQVSPDWDILTVQPDPGLPDAGFYDALALVGDASLVQPFMLTFGWLGGLGTVPGSQAFSINQFDLAGNFSVIDSGFTTPPNVDPIPEPSTLLLVGSGIAVALQRKWRQRRLRSGGACLPDTAV